LLVPTTPVHGFDGIRITLLGTGGGPAPSKERLGPATLIEAGEEVLLFDCGRGVVQRLAQAGMALHKVQQVFLSHLHADHTVGCPDLWLSGWLRGRDEPLQVLGPKGTVAMMSHISQAFEADIASRVVDNKAGARILAREIEENVIYQTDRVRVTAFVVDHGPMEPAYGFRVDSNGRSVVISGDTRYSENLIRNARGASVVIHEVMAIDQGLLEDSERLRKVLVIHTTPEEVGKVFKATRPGLAVLSHVILMQTKESDLIRRIRSQYSGTLELGYDLMVIEIQNEIQIRGAPSDRPVN
jgi:ribonuclease Z